MIQWRQFLSTQAYFSIYGCENTDNQTHMMVVLHVFVLIVGVGIHVNLTLGPRPHLFRLPISLVEIPI